MAKGNIAQKIEEIVGPICESHALRLYDVHFVAGGRVLQIFIDHIEEGKAIQIEDCEKVSRSLSEILDEDENIIPGSDYTLEVSSPGVERKLSKLWHFQTAVDKKVEVKLFEALGKLHPEAGKKLQRAKTLQGVLKEAGEDDFALEIDGTNFRIPYEKLAKANIVFEF